MIPAGLSVAIPGGPETRRGQGNLVIFSFFASEGNTPISGEKSSYEGFPSPFLFGFVLDAWWVK